MVGRTLGLVLLAVIALGCSSAPQVASGSPSAGGVVVKGAQNVDCGVFADRPQLCHDMAAAALNAVSPHSVDVTNVWLTTRVLCFVDTPCLFDPDAKFPEITPPFGGEWLGSAELAFGDGPEHAGVSIAQIGDQVIAKQIAYRIPPPNWCSGTCATTAPPS